MAGLSRFEAKKQKILEQLNTAESEYHDLSPKGSVDEPVRPLINDINRIKGLVTTSSCSGRVSVFLEGRKTRLEDSNIPEQELQTRVGPGGKGGGAWLFVSHDPIDVETSRSHTQFLELFALQPLGSTERNVVDVNCRYIHLKFEPMILHILTSSVDDARRVLNAALGSGFRESGAVSLDAPKPEERNPMVAVRSAGYSFDAIIGYQDSQGNNIALVDESYLHTLAMIANERFHINSERIARFHSSLLDQYKVAQDGTYTQSSATHNKPGWEDAVTRRQRKRREGLARQRALQDDAVPPTSEQTESYSGDDSLF